jgi:hypothetical protein
MIPAATLLKIINKRVAKVHATCDEKRIISEKQFHTKAQRRLSEPRQRFVPCVLLCAFV